MGAAASAHNANLPPNLKALLAESDALKNEIAVKDAQFLHDQSQSAWKDHDAIIKILSERSKYQLHHIAEVYQKPVSQGGYGSYLETKLKSMLGGPYGEFMRDCVMKTDAIDAEYMHVSLNTLGCEENILAEVICASDAHELEIAVKYYEAVLKRPLKDKIISKTTKGSPFQKLLVAILSHKGKAPKANPADADGHAEFLYNAGLTDKGIRRDDDAIFDFFAKASRETCQLISESYEKIYKLDLVEAILTKYRGPVAFALMLWTADLNDAIVKRIQVNITDPHVKVVGLDLRHLSHLFAKYNHRKLNEIVDAYKELFEVDLVDLVKEKFSGNYRKAVLGWLVNHTCDGGKEEHIAEIMDSFDSIEEMLADSEKTALVEKLLKEQNENLRAYSISHHIHLPEDEKKSGQPISYATALDKADATYVKNFNIMKEYLKERFTIEDEDDSGYLDLSEFSHVMENMNVGFTSDEINNIFKWIDADGNGELSYDECLVELADCCINAILNRCDGKSIPEVIDALNIKHQTDYDDFATGYADTATEEEPTSDLSPSLEGYLKDMFMAADVDNSGQLDPTEFFNVLHTVFNMTDGDKEFLSANWDDNNDGLISWAEALDEFGKIFTRIRDARSDYWIALIDKPTGRFFWFNVRDEHSFWMQPDDEANYQRLISEGLERTEPIKPLNVPKKAANTSGKLSARQVRVLQKKRAKQQRLDKQKSMAA